MIKYVIGFFILINVFSVSAKTLLIGDSLMGTIGTSYQKIQNNEDTTLEFVVGSGLENKKFDWFEAIDKIDMRNYNNVIISLGTNDYGISNNAEYRKKVGDFITLIKNRNPNIDITWVGPPVIQNEKINKGVDNVRSIIKSEANNKNFSFLDVRKVLGFNFMKYKDGEKIRAGDGIHYTTPAGNLIINQYIKEL